MSRSWLVREGSGRGFRMHLWWALRVKLAVFAVVAVSAGFYFSSHATLESERVVVPEVSARDGSDVIAVQAALLLAEHGCWSSAGPEGVVPGHVVVLVDGESAPRYAGRRVTAAVLAQLFEGGPVVGQVFGFCP